MISKKEMALILCDMDMTLLKGISSYRAVMEKTIHQVFNKQIIADLSDFHGSTD